MALTKITTSVVAVNSLTAANIADNSIDATKIANNQILARHIAAGSLTDQLGTLPSATISGNLVVDTTTLVVDSSNNRVGIGTASPASPLTVHADGIGIRLDGTADTTRRIFFRSTSSSNPAEIYADGTLKLWTEDAGTDIRFHTNSNGTNNERMRIDASGNVGIGVTPAAHSSTYKALQIGSVGSIFSHASATDAGSTFFGSNIYNNSGWKYITTNEASFIQQKNGEFYFARAASGSAGAAATFSYPFVINSSGNVGIGTDSPQETLHLFNSAQTWNQYSNIRMSTESDSYAAEIGFHRGTSDDSDRGLFLSGDGSTKHVRVLHGGNVGIGYDTPGQKLQIAEATNYAPPGLGSNGGHVGIFKIDSGIPKYGMITGVASSGKVWQQVQRIDGTATAYNLMLQPSGGNIEIGTNTNMGFAGQTAPGTPIHVGMSTSTGPRIQITHENVGGFGALDIDAYGSATLRLISNFSGSTINGVATGKFGLITPHGRDIVFGTNGTERFRISAGKTGIAFNSDTAQANHLDDYEEGTYNATISCASGNITLYTSYTALRYTKIGRQVHIHGKLAVNSVSSPTGATNLNLPFVISNDTNRSGQADNIMSGYFNGSAVTNGIYPIYGNMAESTSACRLFIMVIPATHNLGDNYTAQGTDYHINFTYTTD